MSTKGAQVQRGIVIAISGIILALGLLGMAMLGLRGPRLLGLASSTIRSILNVGLAVADSRSVVSDGQFTNIVFLHHSVGQNLIRQGRVREQFAEAGYHFWDHGYNSRGLVRPNGTATGYGYNVPNDNTNPDGLARIFAQPVYWLPINTFGELLRHEVIAFKSCFPVSNITSDEQLETYKTHYLSMRDVMDRHPDRIFIILTPPPLNPSQTDPDAAARARAFSNWLTSDEYLSGHPNVLTFDLFDSLAEDDPTAPDRNMLREAYRDGTDSHPNAMANEIIGPRFVDFVINAIHTYKAIWLRTWPPSNTTSN